MYIEIPKEYKNSLIATSECLESKIFIETHRINDKIHKLITVDYNQAKDKYPDYNSMAAWLDKNLPLYINIDQKELMFRYRNLGTDYEYIKNNIFNHIVIPVIIYDGDMVIFILKNIPEIYLKKFLKRLIRRYCKRYKYKKHRVA